MSDFKYACPVCGQHIKCDSSQAGSVMECPTCFQKITVPQAPESGDQKFILTGSKVTEKKYSLPAEKGAAMTPQRKSPVAALLVGLVLALVVAGVGVFFFWGRHSGEKPTTPDSGMTTSSVSADAWQSADIGAVGAAGSFSEAKGVFTLTGSGADIWHQADGFRFVFQSLKGDGSLTAKILGIKNTDEWAKAGVMIRETTNANSVFALASLRADGQAQLIWRGTTAAEAQASELAGGTGYPKWVKIVRSGNSFSAYFKINDGDDWLQLGWPQQINMSPKSQIGLIVCSHHDGTLCDAQFDQLNLQAKNKADAPAPKAPTRAAAPATDANWMLSLDTNAIPEMPAAGRIHGQDFIVERANFQNGTLTLRSGTRGPIELGLTINFAGAQAESLSGQTINVMTNADKAARVTLRWKDDAGVVQKENFQDGYALRLEFGALAKNRLPGKIYLCTPDDEKSYLLGSFNADARKPKPKAPKK